MFNTPTVTEFKDRFDRDFPYADDMGSVRDKDILQAQEDARTNINHELFIDQAEFTNAFNYLTAHHLVTNLKNSQQGINGAYSWLTTYTAVSGVSSSFSIPGFISKSQYLAYLTTTVYGAKYCSIVAPRLRGNMSTHYAPTPNA